MGLFSSAVEVPAVTGTDILRKALCARLFKGALGRIAQDYGCGIAQLESFARDQGDLPPELKQADIVNGLTTVYCPIVFADATLSPRGRALQLDNFSTRVYTQLTTQGAY